MCSASQRLGVVFREDVPLPSPPPPPTRLQLDSGNLAGAGDEQDAHLNQSRVSGGALFNIPSTQPEPFTEPRLPLSADGASVLSPFPARQKLVSPTFSPIFSLQGGTAPACPGHGGGPPAPRRAGWGCPSGHPGKSVSGRSVQISPPGQCPRQEVLPSPFLGSRPPGGLGALTTAGHAACVPPASLPGERASSV